MAKMSKSNDVVDLTLDLIYETEDAFKVTDGSVIVWLPKAMVCQQNDDSSVFAVPEWLAIDRGLV